MNAQNAGRASLRRARAPQRHASAPKVGDTFDGKQRMIFMLSICGFPAAAHTLRSCAGRRGHAAFLCKIFPQALRNYTKDFCAM